MWPVVKVIPSVEYEIVAATMPKKIVVEKGMQPRDRPASRVWCFRLWVQRSTPISDVMVSLVVMSVKHSLRQVIKIQNWKIWQKLL